MTDLDKIQDSTNESDQDELATLKLRANSMGIQYHVNIGVDKLREKVNAALQSTAMDTSTDAEQAPEIPTASLLNLGPGASIQEIIEGYHTAVNQNLSTAQKRNQSMKDANRLVRIQVTCMNPAKRDWPGEVIEVGNSVIGTFKKMVPFNIPAGYHVPHIIYQALKERECQIFVNGINEQGIKIKRAKLIKEFAVEVMTPLSENEIKELAQRQVMVSGLVE